MQHNPLTSQKRDLRDRFINGVSTHPHLLVFGLWLACLPLVLLLIWLKFNNWESTQFQLIVDKASSMLDSRQRQAA